MEKKRPPISAKHLLFYMSLFVVAPTLTYTLGTWLDKMLHLPEFPPFIVNLVLGFTVFFTGLYIGIKATRTLYREGLGLPWGGVTKETQSTKLVTTGPYAYTRNPMVLGYSMLPSGMGIMFQSLSMTIVIPAIILLINIALVKMREEASLEKRFGQDYLEYKKKTPFLVPRITSIHRLAQQNEKKRPEQKIP